jgi:hypothetical protein
VRRSGTTHLAVSTPEFMASNIRRGSGLACRVDELGTLKLSTVFMVPLT